MKISKKKYNGSKYWTIKNLVNRFYRSRFNRDNMHDPLDGEDIDNSRKFRLFSEREVFELMKLFSEYFAWVINEENLSRIYITKDLILYRESVLPRMKMATMVDVQRYPEATEGEYYITNGRYAWHMWMKGDVFEKSRELSKRDPEFIQTREILTEQAEEKNAEKRKNKSTK